LRLQSCSHLGGGDILSTILVRAARMAALFLVMIAGGSLPVEAAGALAVGKCGAYGHAFDYRTAEAAVGAARAQCKGDCTVVRMNRACAAFSVDMSNPCGAHGYAVAPHISSAENTAMKNCYRFGGKECVIRTWACDAKG
jgi:hypothetical protein